MYIHNGNMVDINVPLTINGNQYPAHWFDNTELRDEVGILPCAPTTPAFNELTQKAVQIAPVELNGVWTQQWDIVELTEEEIEAYSQALATTKAAKNMQINLWRAEANQSTFPYQGKLIACDQLSRSDIDGVANSISLNGSFPVGFPNAWRCTDNSYIPLTTVAAFKAMYSAMTAQGTANFAKAQALKTALAAATTQSEVDAILWE